MEPGAEDIHNTDNLSPWSDSEGSHEFCVSESLAESYSDDDVSEEESPFEPQTALTAKSDPESSKHIQEVGVWESTGEQLPGSEEEVSYQEEEDIYHTESRESSTESPHDQTSQTSVSPHAESEPPAGQISRPHSSSSSLGCAAHMTLALTLTTEQPQGASNRHGPGTGNRRVESSEEGGSSEAPPASVFFGISDEGAEQAEKWNSETDTDLCRPDRHRTRSTRLSHIESPSQRHVKETKSKCKRIARLLTDAPNPQNKGALLFKKRRQRVKKYTLVSYGTGDNELDSEGQIGEEAEEVRSAGYNLVATSDSELEEQYSLHQQQQHNLSVNRGSVGEMDALPETSGKGVMMFAQRRKRMDEIQLEHEEMRSKALTVEALPEPECTEAQNMYDTEEMYMSDDQANYMDSNLRQHVDYQDNIPHMNNFGSKALVPNRTAKPFPGFQHGKSAPIKPVSIAPVMKKHEPRFKVPVPINTNPQVWSPTGDIIASRDERISVPAIKTGNMPESKRKPASKQSPMQQRSDLQVQNKGDRRSYIEPEEDFFSLGAEACNFMQPRTVKLKHPPPVAPKPVINPSCPPWMRRSPSSEPCIPPRSPQPPRSPVPHSQHYLQQQDWAHPQQMANRWAADQTQATLQTPATAWAPVNSSSQLHPQPTTNSWSQQPPRSPGLGRSRSLSLPRRLNSVPSPGFLSPVSTPGSQPAFLPMQRQASFQERPCKPLSPWEVASRSPIALVDDAYAFQGLPSSAASNVRSAAQRRSLPEPPDEWRRRVSPDPAAVSKGQFYHAAPAFQAPSMSRTVAPEKPAFYGPPFRRAQPLGPASGANFGYVTQGSSPTKYSPLYGSIQRS
ncbi:synaptopodin-2 isoform X3 [Mugil cephalus]|uniref:synaptopodin-2 isoform X3 n=1 Tax=Mugil cephalus TaxID=48193 RepID=UPI001FB7A1E1|nr:synaptopodin-2 isoform X3 [Mugil cephalus]